MRAEYPVLQLALDYVNSSQAMRAAREAVDAGRVWLEAGTPLIKSEGVECVRQLRSEFPDHVIVADMKIMDAGRVEVEMAAKAGADIVAVLGAASDSTIEECIEAADRYDAQILVDLLETGEPGSRARRVQEVGAGIVGVHCGIDVQMRAGDPFGALREVAGVVDIPVAVAGGINSETAADAVEAGADIVIVGGAINKAPDATEATERILAAIATGEAIETELYKRGGEAQIRDVLETVTAANVSDAQHRKGWLPDIGPLESGMRCVGPAFTVWTYPGDWNKPVQAIDRADEGSVIVVDVRGEGPAVWGEEASKSCMQAGIEGVVVHGGIRDTGEICELGFPAFCSVTCPSAGEPKGMGMHNVPLKIGETMVRPGDWIIADTDGVIAVPEERAVEVANRAMSVVERESREKAEIDDGSTLGKVTELDRWEQQRRGEQKAEDTEDSVD